MANLTVSNLLCAIRSERRAYTQTCYLTRSWLYLFANHIQEDQEAVIEGININYNLLEKSSLDISFNKLFTNLWLPLLKRCDYKTVRESPENILLHTELENPALSTCHIKLKLSTKMTNLTAQNLKSVTEYDQ
jgi:hypothetical protein